MDAKAKFKILFEKAHPFHQRDQMPSANRFILKPQEGDSAKNHRIKEQYS